MREPILRTVQANGISLRIAEQGSGPVVLLCHGFPESWYSWRHQMTALAEAGYRAIAPDMRGYGGSDAPAAIDQYTQFHLVGDMIGILDALGVARAVIAGHDWGAPVAWNTALLRPDRIRGVIGLSVPHRPRRDIRPSSVMPRDATAQFYQLYFQTPGVAEEELERDVWHSLRTILTSGFGDDAPDGAIAMVPRDGGLLTRMRAPAALPDWLRQPDLDYFAGEFGRAGFRGGLNWYRNIDRNWELMAPYAGAVVTPPALYIAGDRDLVVRFPGMDQLLPNLKQFVPNLRGTLMLRDCSHWTQQERPAEVNAAMLAFLGGLPD